MNRIAVFGIGSPFGTDSVAWEIIDNLTTILDLTKFDLKKCDRPGSRLLADLAAYHTVYLIDAILSDQPIGTVQRLVNEEIEQAAHCLSTHGFGLSNALALGRSLGAMPKFIILYGIVVNPNELYDAVVLESAKQSLQELLITELSFK